MTRDIQRDVPEGAVWGNNVGLCLGYCFEAAFNTARTIPKLICINNNRGFLSKLLQENKIGHLCMISSQWRSPPKPTRFSVNFVKCQVYENVE